MYGQCRGRAGEPTGQYASQPAPLPRLCRVPVSAYSYNPQDVGRVSGLLAGGAIMGVRLQPHESHLPFLLQFKVRPPVWWSGAAAAHASARRFLQHVCQDFLHSFGNRLMIMTLRSPSPSPAPLLCVVPTQIDFNLLGMGLLRLDRVLFRGDLPARARPPPPGWERVLMRPPRAGGGGSGGGSIAGGGGDATAAVGAGGAGGVYGAGVELEYEQPLEEELAGAGPGRRGSGAGRGSGSGKGSGGGPGASGSAGPPTETPPDPVAMAAAADAANAATAFAAVAAAAMSGGGTQGNAVSGGAAGAEGTPGGTAGGGSMCSVLRASLQRRVEGMLWTRHTTPPDWTWAGAVLPSRVRWAPVDLGQPAAAAAAAAAATLLHFYTCQRLAVVCGVDACGACQLVVRPTRVRR